MICLQVCQEKNRLCRSVALTDREEAIRIHLSQYREHEVVPMPIIRQVVQDLSVAIGIQADMLAKALQIDVVTGHRALPEGSS
jgi:hypothetical protein